MTDNPIMLQNFYSGYYDMGRFFGRDKWYEIDDLYDKMLEAHGSVTVRQLAEVARVSGRLDETSIHYYAIGFVVTPYICRGHGCTGVGSLSGMTIDHHQYVYQLYLNNPYRPLEGYIQELYT